MSAHETPPSPTIRPGFMRIDEFMTFSRLGRSKVYELIQAKDLDSVTVGRRRLIPWTAVDAWVARLNSRND